MLGGGVHCEWHQGRVRWRMLMFTMRDRGGLGGGCWCSLCVASGED